MDDSCTSINRPETRRMYYKRNNGKNLNDNKDGNLNAEDNAKCSFKIFRKSPKSKLSPRINNTIGRCSMSSTADQSTCQIPSKGKNGLKNKICIPSNITDKHMFKKCKIDDFVIGTTIGTGSYATVCIAKYNYYKIERDDNVVKTENDTNLWTKNTEEYYTPNEKDRILEHTDRRMSFVEQAEDSPETERSKRERVADEEGEDLVFDEDQLEVNNLSEIDNVTELDEVNEKDALTLDGSDNSNGTGIINLTYVEDNKHTIDISDNINEVSEADNGINGVEKLDRNGIYEINVVDDSDNIGGFERLSGVKEMYRIKQSSSLNEGEEMSKTQEVNEIEELLELEKENEVKDMDEEKKNCKIEGQSEAEEVKETDEEGKLDPIDDVETPNELNMVVEEKVVALKILNKSKIVSFKQLTHVKNEGEILSFIKHPFIVGYLGRFQDNHNLYFILEFLGGGELFSYLRKYGRFSLKTVQFYTSQVLLALEYLHKNGVIYRDLKPENILLDFMGYIRLVDFGFAKTIKTEGKTYTVCGTCEYLAPEIFLKKGHGYKVDFYSLGVLLYELLVGVPPFYSSDPQITYKMVLNHQIKFPKYVNGSSKDIIKNLLEINPDKRLGTNIEEIYLHSFFAGINFNRILLKAEKCPILPVFKSKDDVSNFIKYPEVWKNNKEDITKEQQEFFKFF